MFLRSAPPSGRLLHVNLLGSPADVRLAVTVLQGLVNREKPRIYISQDPGWHGPGCIPKWMDGLKERGFRFDDVGDPLSLFSRFSQRVRGAVLYEPDLAEQPSRLHKLNVLTLYCALEDAVPVTPELNARLGLKVLLDARGRFETPAEAYGWARTELWPRASRSALAFLSPDHIVLRDYVVQHRILPFWISDGMDAGDEALCLSFIDEAAPNSPLMGCWGGYGEKPAGRISEAQLQRLASLRGKFVLVSDGCFNLSVHSGLSFTAPPARPRPRVREILDDKVYVTFSVTDGDNLQYVQQYLRSPQWWEDTDRGKVPIGWSMNPAAAELMPDVLDYFLRTATANDEFFCSTAGIGLVTPSLYGKDLYSNAPEVYADYLWKTGAAMKRAGLRMVHLGDTSSVPWTRADFDDWARAVPFLDGILGDYGRAAGISYGNAAFLASTGAPVIRSLVAPGSHGPDDRSPKEFADAIRAATPADRPAFIHVCLVNWFMSPGIVRRALELLGPDYVPVLPSEMFSLLRGENTER